MELTVLGCSGSFGAPPAGACSGYLVRHGATAIWMDCGNGTFSHLQEHIAVNDLDAVTGSLADGPYRAIIIDSLSLGVTAAFKLLDEL